MKAIINKIFHAISLGIIGIMLVLVMFLTLLRLATPYFETYHSDIENFVSQLIQQPVSVRKITVSNAGLEPVVTLMDVSVFNEGKTKVLLRMQRLQIGIDLMGSLFTWSIKPGLLIVDGVDFSVYQDKNGGLSFTGSVIGADFAFTEILKWLFEQSKISLNDVVLTWHLANGELLKFTDLRLKLNNGVLQHELAISGKFVQKNLPARFYVDLKLRGDVLKQAISSLTGEVVIEDSVFKWPQKISGGNFFIPESGNVNLLIKRSQVVSNLLRDPLSIDNLEGRVIWQNSKSDLNVHVDKFKYQDNYLAMHGNMRFLFPIDKQMPIVDMQLEFRLTNLAKAKLYYPVNELPPDATVWLDKAFISSKPMAGSVILQGPLAKFPFDHNEGRFLANANIRDVHLNYNDDWPPVDDLNGKIVFANRSMTILAHNAKIMRAPIESIKAIIPDLDMPILSIDSSIRTDSSVGMKFVNSSPLKKTIASKLQSIKLTGPMRLGLKMVIPLTLLVPQKDTKVDGNIVLHDNHLQPYGLDFGLDDIQGELRFTENDLVADKLSGKLFGRPVQLAISTLKDNVRDTITKITMTGSATVNNVEKGFSVNLSPYVTGNFKYQALLELHDVAEGNVFKLTSDLQGIAIDLPEPFAKTTATNKSKFHLAYYFGGNKLSRIMINYNDQINAALTKKGGEIKFGATPAKVLDISGIVISGSFKKLDWSVWHDYLSQMKKNFKGTGASVRKVGLNIDELYALGQKLKKVVLQAKPKNSGWEIMLSMPTIQGKIFFPGAVGEQIQGVFQKFYFDSNDQQQKATIKPQDLQSLHFIINDFRYGNKKFDKVEFITKRQPKGLQISKITISDPYFKLAASGDWIEVGDKQQTVLRGKINSADVGGLFKQLELTNDLIGGKGEANFALKWLGAPYEPTLKKLEGSFAVSMSKGQIINLSGKTEVKLGLSRVLNMFSLRHLSLDLGDLTKKGFGFDKLEGTFEITNGNAFANKINLDGPIAGVKAKGRIGLVSQDYDINLSVTPHITSSVPVAATFVGGPVVGVVSWLVADIIVAPAIKKVTTYTYHITGGWDNPNIQKI